MTALGAVIASREFNSNDAALQHELPASRYKIKRFGEEIPEVAW
jgi:hypothetical protein